MIHFATLAHTLATHTHAPGGGKLLSHDVTSRFGRRSQRLGMHASSQSQSLFEAHAPDVFAYTVAHVPARQRHAPGFGADSLQPTDGGAGPGRHAVATHSLSQ